MDFDSDKGNGTALEELRACDRAVAETPFDNFGLAWRNYLQNEL